MAWSAATYCVCWLQDTISRLCANFEEQGRAFSEVSSRSSMNPCIVNHVSEKRYYIFKMMKLRLRSVKRTINQMIQWFPCVESTPQSNAERAKQTDTSGHFRYFFIHLIFIKPKGIQSLFITSIEVDGWISSVAWWPSMMQWRCIEKILAIKLICGNSPGFGFLRCRLSH